MFGVESLQYAQPIFKYDKSAIREKMEWMFWYSVVYTATFFDIYYGEI